MSSRVRLLFSSASEPPRNTTTRSARAVSAKVCLKPLDMAKTETNTATTQAIPITMTLEAPRRCGKLASPIRVK
jgi:hypothetical protein